MTKTKLRKLVNKTINGIANGIFSDNYWHGVGLVLNALHTIDGIEIYLNNSKYDHDENGTPCRKVWLYEITDGQNDLYVHIIASGAGSVEDPLEKYDIVAYCS